jgi:hypothetical protein
MATASAKPIVCPACGYKNSPTASRCVSCGAAQEASASASRAADGKSRELAQSGFSFLWGGISFAVLAVLTGALVIGLPMVVSALDFEGSSGMLVSIPVWFLGGTLIGMISPGRTFVEPVIAALFVAIPTVAHLVMSQTVKTMPVFMYVIMAGIGVMFTLIGAYLGERVQSGPAPKTSED